jgi:hypothetical protein
VQSSKQEIPFLREIQIEQGIRKALSLDEMGVSCQRRRIFWKKALGKLR